MVQEFLETKRIWFIHSLERFTQSGNWKIKSTVLAILLSLFFAFPSYQTYLSGKLESKWSAISEQIKDPFSPKEYSDMSHNSKLAFRLTVPVIAHVLHVDRIGCFVIQAICFIILFYTLLSLAYSVTQDKITSLLILGGIAFMFVGNVLVSDLRAIFDVVAFCFMALTMLSRNFFFILGYALLAYFTDERALVASGLIFIWFIIRDLPLTSFTLQDLMKLKSPAIAVVFSWLLYFLLRWSLGHYFGLKTSDGGTNMLSKQLNNILFGAWTGLEGFWVIVGLGCILLYLKRYYLLLLVISGAMLVVMYVAYSVIDITRSFAYIFPVIFIFLQVLAKLENREAIRKYALITFLICLFPTYYTDGEGGILYYFPLPFRIAGLFMHGS
jgi:hypothetical protein